MLLTIKGAFPGINENGLFLLVHLLRLIKGNFGNDGFFAPTVDQGNPVVVVDVDDQGEHEAQAQHEDIIEPGELPQLDLVHHLGFQAPVSGHQPAGQLLDDMPGQLGILIQEAVEFLLGDLDEGGILQRLHRGGAGLSGDQGHLPKIGPGPQLGQIGLNPVGGLPENPDPAGLNDVEKFRGLALADDARAGGHAHLLSQLAEF